MDFDGGSDAPKNAHRMPPSMADAARCMLDACSMRFPAGPTMVRGPRVESQAHLFTAAVDIRKIRIGKRSHISRRGTVPFLESGTVRISRGSEQVAGPSRRPAAAQRTSGARPSAMVWERGMIPRSHTMAVVWERGIIPRSHTMAVVSFLAPTPWPWCGSEESFQRDHSSLPHIISEESFLAPTPWPWCGSEE